MGRLGHGCGRLTGQHGRHHRGKVDGKDLAGGLAVGIAVRLRSGILGGAGLLDADGVAEFPLVNEEQQPVTESVAWDHDWRTLR